MAQTPGFDPTTQVKTCFDCKMFDVANWVASLNGEDGPGGTPSHDPFSVSSKEHCKFPQSLNSLLPWTETISAHLHWWQNSVNVMKAADLHPKDHSIQLFTDASNEAGALDQMVFSSTVVQANMPKVVLTSNIFPDPQAWDIDALKLNWTGLTAYAYTPPALL